MRKDKIELKEAQGNGRLLPVFLPLVVIRWQERITGNLVVFYERTVIPYTISHTRSREIRRRRLSHYFGIRHIQNEQKLTRIHSV